MRPSSARLKHSVAWILEAMIVWTGQFAPAQSPTATAFVLNLRRYGWEPPDRREANGPSIAVDHEGRVLVGFTARERAGLVTRSQPSLSFRVLRFSSDGKVGLSLSLPTNVAGRTGVYLSDTDQIIARANEELQLLDERKGDSQEGVWRILTPCALRWLIEQSPSRHTLLLHTAEADPVMVIRLSQQPAVQQCREAPEFTKSTEDKRQNWPTSITDEFAYFLGGEKSYRWPLCDYGHRVEIPEHLHGRWAVLNDKTFASATYNARKDQWRLKVISSEGQTKFEPDMVKHESASSFWVPIRSSERGDRIAVDIETRQGGNRTLDISSHVTARRIAVYDIEAGKELGSVPVNPEHHYRFEFDLGPDGHRLAILEDEMVRVVDLGGIAPRN